MRNLNARHPWSHNDHFHSWIMANLPERRRTALDVGCGRGELLAATSRCAGLSNVTIRDSGLPGMAGPFDLVTMVAGLHHLEVKEALREVRRLLAPGGRFQAVGLAPPRSTHDHLWDLASIVANPIIGYVKRPWPNRTGTQPPPFPVAEPTLSFNEVYQHVTDAMPGAVMRHRLGVRVTSTYDALSGIGTAPVHADQVAQRLATETALRRMRR